MQIKGLNALVGATSTTGQRGWFSTERQLPAPRRIVLYQTGAGQRLGYMDEHQQWRRLNGQTEPEKVISWVVAHGPTTTSMQRVAVEQDETDAAKG